MLLALETSTSHGSVALFDLGDKPLFNHAFTANRSHSSGLFSIIEQALTPDLVPAKILVGLGPGSYAGVRIAISAAIGLSVATGAELLGLPSIMALADGEYLAVGDARRGAYSLTHIRDARIIAGPDLLPREDFDLRLANVTLPILTSEPLELPNLQLKYPDASRLARIYLSGNVTPTRAPLEPIYLRDPHITVPLPR